MAIRVDVASIAGTDPAIFERLRRGLRILVIAQKDAWATKQHLALRADFDLDLWHRRTYGIGAHPAVRLHADKHTRLGHPVQLLHIDAQRAIEGKNLRPDRLTSGIRQANASQTQIIFEGAVD